MIELNVNAVDGNGQPIAGAIIECVVLDKNLAPCPFEPKIKQQPNFYSGAVSFEAAMPTLPNGQSAYPGPYFVYGTVQAAGFNPGYFPKEGGFGVPWDGNATLNIGVQLSFKRPPCPVPVPRGSLPPFPSPIDYRVSLPWTPPISRDFLRADSWGVEMPDAPIVPGASSRFPDRVLSWFVDRYDATFQRDYLCKYNGYGYTHLKRSYEDSCGPPENRQPGNGQTLDQFVASCRENKRLVKYVQVMLGSKDFSPWNMTFDEYRARFEPVIDALIAAKAVDELVPGWEWNLWNTPGDTTIAICKWVGQKAHAAGLSCWLHFSPHYTSWQADGKDRFSFWDALGPDVDGLNYQTIPEWSMKDTQDRLVDTLWWFGLRGNIWKLRFDEDQASPEWDNFGPAQYPGLSYPEYANQRGFLACCTIDDVRHTDAKIWGFGNGGRMPDGSPL